MTLGYKEALQTGPLPKVEFAPPAQDEMNIFPSDQPDQPPTKIIPYTDPFGGNRFATGSDPLTGPTSPDDMSGLITATNKIERVLQKILLATRAIHPNMPCEIVGNPRIAINSQEFYKFLIDGKPVPALAMYIQNNSGSLIFLGLDRPGTTSGIQLPSGQGTSLSLASVHSVGIYVTAASIVNGLVNTEVQAQAGITFLAWTNSEYTNVWGQAS